VNGLTNVLLPKTRAAVRSQANHPGESRDGFLEVVRLNLITILPKISGMWVYAESDGRTACGGLMAVNPLQIQRN
jgi:hypothetical protein